MKTILHYLENSAHRLPDKIAFADPERTITFRGLEESSRRIGTRLSFFCEPCSPVPVFLEKSVGAIEAFLGVVQAGCFYVQLDLRQPAARLRQILDTLQAEVVITDTAHLETLWEIRFSGRTLLLEELKEGEAEEARLAEIRSRRTEEDPLYCNFTSGTTGTPKGVLVAHRSVVDFIDVFTELFAITETDVIGNQAPFDFDVSVKDIYSTLKTGCTMQIIPTRMFSFPAQLIDYLAEREVTVLIWAVSALCLVSQLHGFDYRIPHAVRLVIFSGEVMPAGQLRIWQEALPQAEFVNVYGPTEITCNCTYHRIGRIYADGETIPIGKPFPQDRVFLLDEEDRLIIEPGVSGEICVAGGCLALGYYRDPAATQRAFVPDPTTEEPREIVYRTGDLAWYDEAGDLHFAARKDHQIKHMGHRIELGEIESAMERLPQIERACCLYLEKRIVAFYLGDGDRKELARDLAMYLPPYMIPNAWVACETFSLTAHGKIDRKQLEEQYRAGMPRRKTNAV